MGKIEIKLNHGQEFITLQALLQITDIISTGGMAKVFLMENVVKVNGIDENRRGRKLYPDDEIDVLGSKYLIKKP